MSYRAFLSYSRQNDRAATWLHRQLDAYRTPKALVETGSAFGPVPSKLHPIYRDRTDTAGGGHLAEKIESALNASETLIVLCSPDAVASPWVEKEVQAFLKTKSDERVFPVIAPDLPNVADVEREFFPAPLRGRDLLAADLREIKLANGKVVGDGREGGRLKLIAGLLNVDLDQLIRRERAAERRRRAVAYAAAAALGVLALAAAGAGAFALVQRNLAIQEQERAERGEASARTAQALAEQNAREREEQRVLADANAAEANVQRGLAEANAKQATAERDRAFNSLARIFSERSWQAIDRGDLALGVRYALAGWRIAPANVEDYRAALGAALQAGYDTILAAPPGYSMGYEPLEVSADGRQIAAPYWGSYPGKDYIIVWRQSDAGQWSELARFEGGVAAFSPDGQRILVDNKDGQATIYDLAAEKALVSVRAAAEHDTAKSVAFSPDGRSIVTVGAGVVVWDGATGRELQRLPGNGKAQRAVFMPDGHSIVVQAASSGEEKTIVYDVATGSRVRDLPGVSSFGPHPFSPDGFYMVGTAASDIAVIDLRTATLVTTINNKRGYVGDAPVFSPDGKQILASSEDRTALVWDAATGTERLALQGHTGQVWSAVYSAANASILTTSADGAIRIWQGGQRRRLWSLDKPLVFDVGIGSRGPALGVREQDAERVFTPATGKSIAYPAAANRITLDAEGDAILTWRNNSTVEIRRTIGDQVIFPAIDDSQGRFLLAGVATNKNASRIVTSHYRESSNYPRSVRLWSGDGRVIATLPEDEATDMVFSPAGDRLLVSSDHSISLYDAATGRQLGKLETDQAISRPLFSPDGKLFAAGGFSDAIIWNARTLKSLEFIERGGTPLAFSADGALLALSSGTIWNVESNTLVVSIPLNSADAMAFSPDDTRLLSVGPTGVQVWEAVSGHMLAKLAETDYETARDPALAWISTDGGRAFAHHGGNVTAMWDISRLTMPMPALAALACGRFLSSESQKFTDAEIQADPLLRQMWQAERSASHKIVLPSQPPEGGGKWVALTREGFQIHGGESRSVCAG